MVRDDMVDPVGMKKERRKCRSVVNEDGVHDECPPLTEQSFLLVCVKFFYLRSDGCVYLACVCMWCVHVGCVYSEIPHIYKMHT